MLSQWKVFFVWLGKAYRSYGGLVGLAKSPFVGIALIVAALNYSEWKESNNWIEASNALIPSLLGFSLGTYAIVFSIIGGKLKKTLRTLTFSNNVSYLESINATFFHFIFVQVVCLLWTLLYKGTWFYDLFVFLELYFSEARTFYEYIAICASYVGYFLLVYSILLMVAAAQAVYRLAMIKDPEESSG